MVAPQHTGRKSLYARLVCHSAFVKQAEWHIPRRDQAQRYPATQMATAVIPVPH